MDFTVDLGVTLLVGGGWRWNCMIKIKTWRSGRELTSGHKLKFSYKSWSEKYFRTTFQLGENQANEQH